MGRRHRQAQGRRRRLRTGHPQIKGGLLVNIGVNVFLPASQVDIRRPPDIASTSARRSSARSSPSTSIATTSSSAAPAPRRPARRDEEEAAGEIQPGQTRTGVVKNIAQFGAFVDLGGIDGLLHVSDMSWGRVSNPHEVVHIDQQLDVYIISVDKEK